MKSEPHVRELFEAFVAMLRAIGPFEILPEKTRIAFHVRMSFAVLSARKSYLIGHFVLPRRIEDGCFTKIATFSPRNHVHSFRIAELQDVEPLRPFAEEAYAVGEQRHLAR